MSENIYQLVQAILLNSESDPSEVVAETMRAVREFADIENVPIPRRATLEEDNQWIDAKMIVHKAYASLSSPDPEQQRRYAMLYDTAIIALDHARLALP